MKRVCIFNIGTWHNHHEKENVLVKLMEACQYTNLGVIENQSGKTTGKEALDRVKKGVTTNNGGYKWINDGANSLGTGIIEQTNVNMEVLELLSDQHHLSDVVIVGHSRGAILSIRIAAKLLEALPDVRCHLFLYDPVKRMSGGTDKYNREIHENVKSIRVIAMEDQTQLDFKLMTIKRRNGSSDRGDIKQSDYTRLPGTHGTATQVTGHPIGQVGCILALIWLNRCSVSLASGVPIETNDLLKAYCEIPRKNPVKRIGSILKREVNDFENGRGFTKMVTLGGGRTAKLDQKAGENKFMGTQFFVNEQHYSLFVDRYPILGSTIAGRQRPKFSKSKGWEHELDKLKIADSPTYVYIDGLLRSASSVVA